MTPSAKEQSVSHCAENSVASTSGSPEKFCRKCGTPLLSDSAFCHKCGTKFIETVSPPNSTPPQDTAPLPRPQRKAAKRLVPLVVVIVIAAGLFFSRNALKAAFSHNVSITEDSNIPLLIGDTHTIEYETDQDSVSADEIIWESSESSVAEVSKDGVITAVDEGTAVITASVGSSFKDSCTVTVSPKPLSVANGQMLIFPQDTGYPEVTIHAPPEKDCFVYFENLLDYENDFAFYVKADSSATVNAPVGLYKFFYAAGETWYGMERKFGKDTTSFYMSPDEIELSADSTTYDVLELTLYVVSDGNMDVDPIHETDFPI